MSLGNDDISIIQILGIVGGALFGIIHNFLFLPISLSLSLNMMLGFFVVSIVLFFVIRGWDITPTKEDVEKIEIDHRKYGSMLQFASIVAGGIFVGMLDLLRDYPSWQIGHEIFFLFATVLFLGFLLLAFRWWHILRIKGVYEPLKNPKNK